MKKISASEINRYTYCPYQWYYEKKYGRKKLLELQKELRGDYKPTGNSPMAYGNKFHKHYYTIYRIKTAIKCAVFIMIIALVVYFLKIYEVELGL